MTAIRDACHRTLPRAPRASTAVPRHGSALCALALVLASTACGGGDRSGATADSAVLHSAALDSARRAGDSLPSPIGGDTTARDGVAADSVMVPASLFVLAADSAAGDSLYRRGGLCLTCHGVRGEGVPNLGPDLRDSVWLHGDGSVAAIERVIVEGVAEPKALRVRMPAFAATLRGNASRHVAAYVYTLSHPGMTLADTASFADSILLSPTGTSPAP